MASLSPSLSVDTPSPICSLSPLPFSQHRHHHQQQQQPSVCLVPATPGASPKPLRPSSVHTQLHDAHCFTSSSPLPPVPARSHQQEDTSADQEVSLITHAGMSGSNDTMTEDSGDGSSYTGYQEGQSLCLRELKRFHSVDTQGRSTLLPRPRPYSWLDDPRRHSVEVCSMVESSPQRSTASNSSGFVSQTDSLQIQSQTPIQISLASPRRKKKMSPPCISVDPPDGLDLQPNLYQGTGGLGGMGLGGLGMPSPLPSRDTYLRRRVPSSDSKDSFEMGVAEGSGQDGGSPNPSTNPKLLTLPSFSFEKTSSEHWTQTDTCTYTRCTPCIRHGNRHSNNAVESNNGKNYKQWKHSQGVQYCRRVTIPHLCIVYCQNNRRRREQDNTSVTISLFSDLVPPVVSSWTAIVLAGLGKWRYKAIWTF